MDFESLLKEPCEWLRGSGPHSDIVISSRIRLARNFCYQPFSHWANEASQSEVLKRAKSAITSSNYLKNGLFIKMADLSSLDKQFLIERHLVSREHVLKSDHKAVVVGDKEIVSVMINEEDHLRIQIMQAGFNLLQAWQIAKNIDKDLSVKIDFAYSKEWGYLTACPTNVGTGMRASVMMHLPALVMGKQIGKILHAITKLNLTARGFYGEGTEATGNFFQISNQVTLGQEEEEIIDNIERVIKQVIAHEENSRRSLIAQNKAKIEDLVWRSFATLKSAHIITSQETIGLLSAVRLGADLKIIKSLDSRLVNELLILTQPAHLQKKEGKTLTSSQRDVKRAEIIREKLRDVNV